MLFNSETISLIRDDHKQIRMGLAPLLEQKLSINEKRAAFAQLSPILESHSQREELAVYEFMIDECEDLETLALEGEVEHSLIDELVGKLKLKPKDIRDREWIASAQVLAELIQHHLNEEEEKMFPELKKCLNETTDRRMAEAYRSVEVLASPFRTSGIREVVSPLLLTLMMTLGAGSVHAETTAAESAENTANKAADTVNETIRDAEDKTCEMVNGKMQCVAKKVKHKVKTTTEKAGTKAKEIQKEAN